MGNRHGKGVYIYRTVVEAFAEIGIKVEFARKEITMEGKKIEGDWKKLKGV